MTVKLLTEHQLFFLNIKGGCTGSSESTFVEMPHCWKSHVAALMEIYILVTQFQVSASVPYVPLIFMFCAP